MGRQCITGTGKEPRDYSRMGFYCSGMMGITARVENSLRLERQDLSTDHITEIQQEAPSSAFRVTPPDRDDIVSWVCSSWKSLTTPTIVGGFAKVGILGDTRVGDVDAEDPEVAMPDLIEKLKNLDALSDLGDDGDLED
ncbi:hypothetical protein DVH05_006702 [Phytophthora capsici]|nr:hypothetical protein DVH05_006702 [Phytophthora capsici]